MIFKLFIVYEGNNSKKDGKTIIVINEFYLNKNLKQNNYEYKYEEIETIDSKLIKL
jgi:hypothetical protein